MQIFMKQVTQSGNDAFTSAVWDTGLSSDGKSGIEIKAVEAFWLDGSAVASGDWYLHAKVATVSSSTDFNSANEIARVSWGLQNTGGVAVAVPYEPLRGYGLLEPRVTVQPNLYVGVESAATGQANDIVFKVYYDIIKLSEIEVLRLLAGGA